MFSNDIIGAEALRGFPESFCGVVEGFYGRPWDWDTRCAYSHFLKGAGYGLYIYAPKSDSFLRSKWAEPWPEQHFQHLLQLAKSYRGDGLRWGLGLSPMEIYQRWDTSERSSLKKKLQEKVSLINQLQPDILCILFDDMKGDNSKLASLQSDIVHTIADMAVSEWIIVCPTYYSTDPLLSSLFGPMPDGYWEQLGQSLAPEIDLFWTGDQVCSQGFDKASLQTITEKFCRKPVLWDNYPVNDGKKSSQFLHLKAFSNRPHELCDWAKAHVVNPMNAAHLSQIPLLTLIENYRLKDDYQADKALSNALLKVCGASLTKLIEEDIDNFQSQGLSWFNANQRQALMDKYRQFDHPCVTELCAWLNDEYQFDPNCLTA